MTLVITYLSALNFLSIFINGSKPNRTKPKENTNKGPPNGPKHNNILGLQPKRKETRRGRKPSTSTTCSDAQHPMNTRQDDGDLSSSSETEAAGRNSDERSLTGEELFIQNVLR
ncbi:hypothetical protein YC2023_028236 [Brassica napus]